MPRAQYFVTRRKGEWVIRAGYRYSAAYPGKDEALRAAIEFAEREARPDARPRSWCKGGIVYSVRRGPTETIPTRSNRNRSRKPSGNRAAER